MPTPFDAIVLLGSLDQKLAVCHRECALLQGKLKQCEEKRVSLRKAVDEAHLQDKEARKHLHDLELDLQIIAVAEKKAGRAMESTGSAREYQVFEAELESLKNRRAEREEQIFNMLITVEQTADEAVLLTRQAQEGDAQLIRDIENIQKSYERIARECVVLEEQRNAAVMQLLPEWREKYLFMSTQIPNPIVPVEKGVCSGCSYVVIASDLAALARHKVLQCTECFRLLYLV